MYGPERGAPRRRGAGLVAHAAATWAAACLAANAAQPVADAEPGSFHVPSQPFAGEPRGPYETGTFEEQWVDGAREDPSTSDPHDKRKVIVQVWYPAAPPKNARLAPYAISPQLYGKNHWVHGLAHVQTRSIPGAPLAAQPGRFPILIYNHGGLHPHFSATFQTEFLASQGYVVVSIGHPGANEIERFPDGTPYSNDGAQWMVQPAGARELPPRERWEYSWAKSDIHPFVEDVRFVLDRLERLNAAPRDRLHQRLDLDRVGTLGWSLGGMVALQAAREDSRIKAAANLDGWPFGLLGPDGVVTRGSDTPILLMFGGGYDSGHAPRDPAEKVNAAEMEAGFAAATYYWSLLRRSTADWYHVTLERANHEHFSDVVLFRQSDARELHPRAAHAIVNAYTLAFFDRYVRGTESGAPLLSVKQQFPEATLLWGTGTPRPAPR